MISIVVSSYNNILFANYIENVKNTIGNIIYEIIRVYNPNKMGLCEAYNKGAALSQYEFLIFSHEDILFHTQNWGQILIDTFHKDKNIGLIGVLGSSYKPFTLSGWGGYGHTQSKYMIATHFGQSVLVKIKEGKTRNINLIDDKSPQNLLSEDKIYFEEVVTIDGMFMATQKNVYNKYNFDDRIFKNFHCYDIDFSLQIAQEFKVIVLYNILIEHFSVGSMNKQWVENTKILHKKWNNKLPYHCKHYSEKELAFFEFSALVDLIKIYRNNNILDYISILQLSFVSHLRKFGLKVFCYMSFNLINKLVKKISNKILLIDE